VREWGEVQEVENDSQHPQKEEPERMRKRFKDVIHKPKKEGKDVTEEGLLYIHGLVQGYYTVG